jgi:drug/metabolite transporter (DMT)-like permease
MVTEPPVSDEMPVVAPETARRAEHAHPTAERAALVGMTAALFLVWCNTWLVFEVLLAPKSGPAPMTWIDLLVVRFVLAGAICAAYCFGVSRATRRECLAIIRRHPVRLLLCGLLSTPIYNGVVYFTMQQRVAGPVASLMSALAPLYLVIIGRVALHERIRPAQFAGLVIGFGGVALVAYAKEGSGAHGWPVALMAAAPLAWAAYTALTRPILMSRETSPFLWSYLVVAVGCVPLLFLLPFHGGPVMGRLSATHWGLLAFLVLLANIFGNAVWSWLLRHLPASTTGFTVFLNPPMTTASKAILSVLLPASFTFAIADQEIVGGVLALLGVALAVVRWPARRA